MFIDIACNSTCENMEKNLENIISECRNENVFPVFVGLDCETSLKSLQYSEKYRTCCYLGIHPCHLKEEEAGNFDEQLKILDYKNSRVIGIGETGLDYFRNENKELQKKVFKMHLSLKTDLPYFYHCRSSDISNAYDDFLDFPDLKFGVIHSFDGTLQDALKILKKDLYIGINGCSLKRKESIEILKEIPMDRILIETDSPYCLIRKSYAASEFVKPLKLKENRPVTVKQIAEVIAKIKEISIEEVERITYENTLKVFPKLRKLVTEFFKESK